MMQNLEALLEPIRHSPRLLEAVELLNRQVENEPQRRQRFYEDMTDEQKVEFIDGEVIDGFVIPVEAVFDEAVNLDTLRTLLS